MLLALLAFRTRDPDSVLHTRLAVQVAPEPVTHWIAPRWPPQLYMSGLYREHPAGILIVPAALARLGYPAGQATYAVNAVYQVLSLIVIQRLAAPIASGLEARTLGWAIQLLPIAFTYRIRANHEQAVLLAMVVALWATERSRARAAWAVVAAIAFVALALVKGIFVLLAPMACALWLLLRPAPVGFRARSWVALLVASAAIPAVAFGYEQLYRDATGEPFLAVYLGRQLGVAAQPHSESWLWQKAYNLAWYLARLLWFAFPWSVVAIAAAWQVRARSRSVTAAILESDRTATESAGRWRGLVFALSLSLVYLLLFSLSDRKADRYLFPAYYALGAAGIVAAVRGWPAFRRLSERFDRLGPLASPLVWTGLFMLHLAGGALHLPRIKLWPSD